MGWGLVRFPDPLAIGSGLGNLTRFIINDHHHHHLHPFMIMISNMMIIGHLVLRLLVDEGKVEVIVQHLVAIELWRW